MSKSGYIRDWYKDIDELCSSVLFKTDVYEVEDGCTMGYKDHCGFYAFAADDRFENVGELFNFFVSLMNGSKYSINTNHKFLESEPYSFLVDDYILVKISVDEEDISEGVIDTFYVEFFNATLPELKRSYSC